MVNKKSDKKIWTKCYIRTARSIERLGVKLNKKVNSENAITISGSPRTGTTWLMNILSQIKNYKTVFEPLHPTRFSVITDLNLPPRLFIPIETDNIKLQEHLNNVFTGQIVSEDPEYSLKYNEIKKRLKYDKILVKFINSNRLLPWIFYRYKTRANFLIIRHPCASINSQIKSGWIGYPLNLELGFRKGDINHVRKIIIEEMKIIPELQNNVHLKNKIQNLSSMKQLLAVEWSLDYYIPFSYCKNYDFHLILYEHLLKEREETLKDIFQRVNYPIPENIVNVTSKPSLTSDETNIDINRQLNKWKENITKQEADKIMKVVSWFDIDYY